MLFTCLLLGCVTICRVWFVGREEEHLMKIWSVLKILLNVDQVLAIMGRKFSNCLLKSIAWVEELQRRIFFCYLHSFFFCEFDFLSVPYWQLSDSPNYLLKWFPKVTDLVFCDKKKRNQNYFKTTVVLVSLLCC